MVEISNNKKNIIILFIVMIVILFFVYKGFIADNSHYLEEYKNYLIDINASNYYLKKIEKREIINRNNKENQEFEKTKKLLLKIKEYINISDNIIKKFNNDIIVYNDNKIELNKIIKIFGKINDNIDEISDILKRQYEK